MRPATPPELSRWDELVLRNPDGGNILQTRAWGEFKRSRGWLPLYRVHEIGLSRLAVLVLQRRIPGVGSLWYVPKGPGVTDTSMLRPLLEDLAGSRKAFLIKVEPEIERTAETTADMRALGLSKASRDVQITRATIVVDIARDDDALLESFKPKTRYNIRLAERRGVTVQPVAMSDDTVDRMYALMAATQSRAGFTLRPKDYFAGYWRLHAAAGQGQLFFASLDGEVLAGLFATYAGTKAWYKDGGSTKEHANVMAPHLLQWTAMRWLRDRGVTSYDLVAVPPRDQLHESHPLYGLYRFKSGFSDEITEFVGTWDLVVDPLRHRVWEALGERLAHQWTYRVHHDLFY